VPDTEFISRSPDETVEMGRELARRLTPPVLVLLSGDLGSGKTTLSKGIISGLGAAREEDVTSPTFNLVHVFHNHAPGAGCTNSPLQTTGAGYTGGPAETTGAGHTGSPLQTTGAGCTHSPPKTKIYHVDLYRVEEFRDLETLALEDALAEPAIVVIEWSERFALRSDWPRVLVRLEHLEGDTRRITISEAAGSGM
jgi:tRNA threonylcarbamoyladenosine biosynthesis protein TsaE